MHLPQGLHLPRDPFGDQAVGQGVVGGLSHHPGPGHEDLHRRQVETDQIYGKCRQILLDLVTKIL